MRKHRFRRTVAILAGLITIVLLTILTDVLLQQSGIFPVPPHSFNNWWMILLAVAYRTLFSVAGSFVTAALVPAKHMYHAMLTGIICVVLNVAGGIIMRNQAPLIYPLALTLLALPAAWMGGKLERLRRYQERTFPVRIHFL
ncbi:hypothetical protein [Chitinophaga solisilvae]|uniref:hypothetical protein n=1 Tax=Chitinophaga solisilvae TaxID=1233460 RepID=UPI001370C093|nr:hypothetical protein [Chitinophaga solisilvae]